MSHNPGIRYSPRQFTLGALRGVLEVLVGPTESMRFLLSTTVCSGKIAPVRTSTTLILFRTSKSSGEGFCACNGTQRNSRQTKTQMRTNKLFGRGFMRRNCISFPAEVHQHRVTVGMHAEQSSDGVLSPRKSTSGQLHPDVAQDSFARASVGQVPNLHPSRPPQIPHIPRLLLWHHQLFRC